MNIKRVHRGVDLFYKVNFRRKLIQVINTRMYQNPLYIINKLIYSVKKYLKTVKF